LPELPTHTLPDADALHACFAAEGPSSAGIWLRIARRDAALVTVEQQEAVRVALCHGWIDGQVQRCDEESFLQRFTPRRARSRWSRRNVGIAEQLIADGEMRPTGQAEVDRARADGRWEAAYAGQATIEVPADLQAALDADPTAAAFFATLSSQNRYAILYRIHDARRPETRARRIARFVAMCAAGETVH